MENLCSDTFNIILSYLNKKDYLNLFATSKSLQTKLNYIFIQKLDKNANSLHVFLFWQNLTFFSNKIQKLIEENKKLEDLINNRDKKIRKLGYDPDKCKICRHYLDNGLKIWCDCGGILCNKCRIQCPLCSQTICPDCGSLCNNCSRIFCNNCFKKYGMCPACEAQ